MAYKNTLLSQYKTIAISFEKTGQTLKLDLKTANDDVKGTIPAEEIYLSCAYRMESDLTRELQPCSANTDQITDHKRSQLGMYSSVGDKKLS